MELPKTPSFDLGGRRALVTGAGRGIGLACATALAEAGAEVSLWSRTEAELRSASEALVLAGGRADFRVVDVCSCEDVQEALTSAGCYDILINNAGTNRPKPFVEVTEEDYEAVLGLNLRAMFFVSQAVARGMIDAGRGGSLIHISSQMGHVGAARRSLYCASKWGLEGLSKAIAVELAPFGIRSNTIAPTFIETPMTAPFFEDNEFRSSVLSKIKLGRLGKVEDLMGAVVLLASDASALMTGSTLMIDGGWTAD
jgi:NAD(P)-dependent dehydrogenase (short-subunit alcohol dehydrogenase family)